MKMISKKKVEKALKYINPCKTSGPDNFKIEMTNLLAACGIDGDILN